MDEKQKQLVQETFKLVVPIKDQAAEMFYNKLFELDPAVRALFKGDMKRQGGLLMAMIGTAVNGLNRLHEIVPAVQDLGRRHASYGVRKEHYGTVAQALLWTLEQGLGAAWTPEAKEAWTACYTLLAGVMQEAAEEKSMRATAG
ncbi:MAG TPA: globin family protein [Candidatus Angelobacter sp.]|nr:globin family protein [Candidatus Angelobacter sp.]